MKKLLITVNDKRYEVEVEVLEDDEVAYMPQVVRPVVPRTVEPTHTSSKPASHTNANDDPKTLTAPLNGVVLEIKVIPGQNVKQNDIVLVIEAMKMKTNITAFADGKVKEVPVKVKDTIEQGQVLVRFV